MLTVGATGPPSVTFHALPPFVRAIAGLVEAALNSGIYESLRPDEGIRVVVPPFAVGHWNKVVRLLGQGLPSGFDGRRLISTSETSFGVLRAIRLCFSRGRTGQFRLGARHLAKGWN
jgi:hypothetical protein